MQGPTTKQQLVQHSVNFFSVFPRRKVDGPTGCFCCCVLAWPATVRNISRSTKYDTSMRNETERSLLSQSCILSVASTEPAKVVLASASHSFYLPTTGMLPPSHTHYSKHLNSSFDEGNPPTRRKTRPWILGGVRGATSIFFGVGVVVR